MLPPITLAALRSYVDLSEPRLRADGSVVAYVRTVRDFVKDRNVSTLVVVRIDGSGRRTIDAGPSVSSPRWSPDGSRLAYLRAKGGVAQIVVADADGRDAHPVTSAPNGVENFAWSPDGTRFAFVTPDDRAGAARIAAHDDLFDVGDDGFLDGAPPVPSHLWLVASAGGRARRLTHGSWSVFEGSAPFSGGPGDPSWSPDGRRIIFARDANADTAATDRTGPAIVDVATGVVRRVGAVQRYAYTPQFAPDGRGFAYQVPAGPMPSIGVVAVADARGEAPAAANLDRDLISFAYAGDRIAALVQDGPRAELAFVRPGGDARRLDAGNLSIAAFDANASERIAFVASAYGVPPELYVANGTNGRPHAITHENAALRRYAYGRAEHITWTAPDGERSDGIVIHPPRERRGAKYPLLLWSHGGPEGESAGLGFGEEYPGGYDAGVLAAINGWYAFFPNYRGSNDLGNAHEHAIFADPGTGPSRDVFAGLAKVEASYPVDTSQEVIGGHSYGGFMTSWIIGHDARWRAAAVADGAVDFREAYDLSGTGNLSWVRESLGGTPAQIPDLYRTGSPIAYVDAVKTPTLVITGLRDDEVPFTEAWEYYHALRDRHVPVRLLAIPTARHTPSDPVRLEAYYRDMFAWFADHLRP